MIDRDIDPQDMEESALQAEFNMITKLRDDPGFKTFLATMQDEFNRTTDKLLSDDTAVIDIATFFTREEVLATGKVLRRYLHLVDDRWKELKEELETKQKDRTQS